MNIELAVLADAANIADNGKINMLGVFQTIYSEEAPCSLPSIYVVLLIGLEVYEKGNEHKVIVRLVDDDMRPVSESEVIAFTVPAIFPALNPEVPIFLQMANFVFPKFGDYRFRVFIDDKIKHEIKLSVIPIVCPRPE